MKRKVLIITEGYYPYIGGLEKLVTEIAEGLYNTNKYEVVVLTTSREKNVLYTKIRNGITIYYVSLNKKHGKVTLFKELYIIRKLMKKILLQQFDFISVQYLGYLSAIFYTLKVNIPFSVSIHGDDVMQNRFWLIRSIQKKIILESCALISNSYYLAKRLENNIKISLDDKLNVVWNGIHIEDYQSDKILAENEIIVSFGRFVYKKGFDVLIRAFSIVVKDHPNAKLFFAGDGVEKEKCIHLSENLGLKDNIFFLGELSGNAIRQLLLKGRIFVCPSREEAFGIVVLEAMAMGIPVVATDSGGVREIIGNNKYGYLVPVENEKEIANKISFLLDDYKKCLYFRKKGLERAKQFTIDNVVAQYDSLINASVAGR